MKKLFIISFLPLLLFIFPLETSANKALDFPKVIDLGEIDIFSFHNSNNTHYIKTLVSKTFKIKNNIIDKTILFKTHFYYFTYNQPDSIMKASPKPPHFKRSYIAFCNNDASSQWDKSFYHLEPGDSLYFTFTVDASYDEDRFPEDIKEISANLILQYRIIPETKVKYDTILVKFTPKRKKQEIIINSYYHSNHIIYRKLLGDVLEGSFYRYLFNYSFPVYIDSIKCMSEDCNANLDHKYKHYKNPPLPFLLNNDTIVLFIFKATDIKNNYKSKINFKYYCRKESNDSAFVILDTCYITINYLPEVYIEWKTDTLKTCIGNSDTCLTTVETFSNNCYKIDSVTFISDSSLWNNNEINFYCPWTKFPLELDPGLGFLGNQIVFSPSKNYKESGYAVFHISGNGDNNKNESFKRYVLLNTVCEESTIKNNYIKDIFYIYPNPANNYFYIKGIEDKYFVKVNLYDLKGNKILENNINNEEPINIETINEGTYLLKLETNDNNYYFSKLIIKR